MVVVDGGLRGWDGRATSVDSARITREQECKSEDEQSNIKVAAKTN